MDTIKKLEKDLEKEYKKRDKAKAIVDNHQKIINSIKREISDEKLKQRATEREKLREEKMKNSGIDTKIWANEKLNIDSNTKKFIKETLFVYSGENIDISIRELHIVFEELAEKSSLQGRDIRREIFIVNSRAKLMSYRKIGSIIGITGNRVRQIFDSLIKQLKHPKIGRRIMIVEDKNG